MWQLLFCLHLLLYDIVLIVKMIVRAFSYGAGHKAGIIVLVHGICHTDIFFVIFVIAEIAAGIATVLGTHKILLGCENLKIGTGQVRLQRIVLCKRQIATGDSISYFVEFAIFFFCD